MRFSEDWFSFTNLYKLDKELKSNEIIEFAKNLEKYPLFFESEKIPTLKYSEKVVGEDFRKRVLESDEDCLVFLQHPNKEKNGKYNEIFERYTKNHPPNVRPMRIKAINESDSFKFTQ